MRKQIINNLKIDKELYGKILDAINFLVKYRNCYRFKKLGFRRIYPKVASGRYFFINKKLGLFIKCSFTVEILSELPAQSRKLIIPSIILTYNEFEPDDSVWIIQPIADTKNFTKTYNELLDNYFYKFFCDPHKRNVGKYKNKAVVIDW